jgi:pyridoxamine 5'-phosphate oxidase
MTSLPEFSGKRVSADPFMQFDSWYREHLESGIPIPDNVYLGTASDDCKVSLRTVLLKDYSESGFMFYTNYESKKGTQLAKNENAALLFYWPEKNRQVRIEGQAKKVPADLSEKYFSTRPRDSQLAAWASSQSREIPGRQYLAEKFEYYKHLFEGRPVPRPDYWGGFIITPEWFEFWEDRPNRLHDRVTYTKQGNAWIISRLAP